ncbi:hypothetical protein [Gryllotalpicola sp.]|uniref:hypothetical protein n=1 Tax=Gryllotalpicola sp. TaxID=1932787 RepID=UPI0026178EAF|nr:hypothetical protein [Gryllotalpicola sp.]
MADETSDPGAPVELPAMRWLDKPAHHDYGAARSYLALNLGKKTVDRIVRRLAHTQVVRFKAKDILRASGLPLLPRDNADVAKQLERIAVGEALSPCLIVRGHLNKGWVAQIADGYHRVCASNYVDEDADIPVKIISL